MNAWLKSFLDTLEKVKVDKKPTNNELEKLREDWRKGWPKREKVNWVARWRDRLI